jgi:hypothetical protein
VRFAYVRNPEPCPSNLVRIREMAQTQTPGMRRRSSVKPLHKMTKLFIASDGPRQPPFPSAQSPIFLLHACFSQAGATELVHCFVSRSRTIKRFGLCSQPLLPFCACQSPEPSRLFYCGKDDREQHRPDEPRPDAARLFVPSQASAASESSGIGPKLQTIEGFIGSCFDFYMSPSPSTGIQKEQVPGPEPSPRSTKLPRRCEKLFTSKRRSPQSNGTHSSVT